jgi:hypothetical protein
MDIVTCCQCDSGPHCEWIDFCGMCGHVFCDSCSHEKESSTDGGLPESQRGTAPRQEGGFRGVLARTAIPVSRLDSPLNSQPHIRLTSADEDANQSTTVEPVDCEAETTQLGSIDDMDRLSTGYVVLDTTSSRDSLSDFTEDDDDQEDEPEAAPAVYPRTTFQRQESITNLPSQKSLIVDQLHGKDQAAALHKAEDRLDETSHSEAAITQPLLSSSNSASYSTFEEQCPEVYDLSTLIFHARLDDILLIQSWVEESDTGHSLESLLSEIKLIAPQNIRISYEDDCGWHDILKSSIESWTGGMWDWWPLNPPRRRLKVEEARVLWPCVSDSLLSKLQPRLDGSNRLTDLRR